jgi:biopolymer transport protein ExbD
MYNRVLGMIADAEAAFETAYGLVDRLQGKGFDKVDLLMIAHQKQALDTFHDKMAKRFRDRS